jgi:hypothetical protein
MDLNGELIVTDTQSNSDIQPMKVCEQKFSLLRNFNILPQIAVNSGATSGFDCIFVA